MRTLWLFDIEPHEQRYTSEWKAYLSKQLRSAMRGTKSTKWRLRTVSGNKTSGKTSNGAFINFAETNLYKADQVRKFTKFLLNGEVKGGDRLLFTDAWHPGIIQCRYMADLYRVRYDIHSIWHAGSYDKNDLLGQHPLTPRWAMPFERAVFRACSRNYFATEYHRDLCIKRLSVRRSISHRVVGWPMEYLRGALGIHDNPTKSKTILFPHRLSKEKQPEFVKRLQTHLPEYTIVVAQRKKLSKWDYRQLVGECAAVLSFSKQETLGIGVYEAMLCGAVPIVPEWLSYKELYPSHCYPAEWINSPKNFKKHAADLAVHIRSSIAAHQQNPIILKDWTKAVGKQHFNGSALYAELLR
ncbi:MAG: hypothetical protein ABJH63_15320 [Rhizobiaceae bacterium]